VSPMGDTAELTSTNNLPALKLKLKVRKILDTTGKEDPPCGQTAKFSSNPTYQNGVVLPLHPTYRR